MQATGTPQPPLNAAIIATMQQFTNPPAPNASIAGWYEMTSGQDQHAFGTTIRSHYAKPGRPAAEGGAGPLYHVMAFSTTGPPVFY